MMNASSDTLAVVTAISQALTLMWRGHDGHGGWWGDTPDRYAAGEAECSAAVDKAGGKTKNADQTISIDRATVSALRRWRDIQNREREFSGCDFYPGDYVFTREDGHPPHPDTIRQRFDRLAAAAGLTRITFHDLRHSYATAALRAGLNPKVISERIGHADVAFFLQTYAHVLRNDDRDVAEQAAAFLIGDALDSFADPNQEDNDAD